MKTLGVIIGRFQTYELHDGHHFILNKVKEMSDYTLCLIGSNIDVKLTKNNPLSFQHRKDMVQDKYDVAVRPIYDNRSDVMWSIGVDWQIEEYINKLLNKNDIDVTIYGGRDSFIPYYSGKYKCQELIPPEEIYSSATDQRKSVEDIRPYNSEGHWFRKGVIWATQNQWSKCWAVVDAIILNKDFTKILLGRKPGEEKFRIIGGFVNPNETFEQAVVREAFEETGANVEIIKYIKSYVVDDWRYRKEEDKITSSLFVVKHIDGQLEAQDDIEFIGWYDFNDSVLGIVNENHKEMIKDALKEMENV